MAATVVVANATGAGPALASAEGGAKFNREESLAGTTAPIPVPSATGTNFSWPKEFCLNVTGADTTNISNRRHRISGAPATGLKLWFRDDATTYQRPTAVAAADSGTNDSTPAGYTVCPTSDTVYDASSIAAGAGRNGDYMSFALGISFLYLGGAGQSIALPDIVYTYDES